METKTRQKIEKVAKYALPIAGAAAGLALMEGCHVGEFLRDYEITKAEVTRQFYNNFFANMQIGAAHFMRYLPDALGVFFGSLGGLALTESLENKLNKK